MTTDEKQRFLNALRLHETLSEIHAHLSKAASDVESIGAKLLVNGFDDAGESCDAVSVILEMVAARLDTSKVENTAAIAGFMYP